MPQRSRLKEAWLLLIRPSLWVDTAIVAFVMLIELFGVYIAGGMIYESRPLYDPFRDWIADWRFLDLWFDNIFLKSVTPEVEPILICWILGSLCYGYKGHRQLQRGVRSISLLRILRVITYMSTFLPSPRPGCYKFRFHDVPPMFTWPWVEYIFSHGPPVGGGCQDLLFSGHMAMSTLFGCCFLSLSESWWSKVLLVIPYWYFFVLHKGIRTILGYHHYTVDMVVAVYVTIIVYHLPIISREPDDLKAFAPKPKSAHTLPTTVPTTEFQDVFDSEFAKAKIA